MVVPTTVLDDSLVDRVVTEHDRGVGNERAEAGHHGGGDRRRFRREQAACRRWKAVTGHEPPTGDPDDGEISIGELVVFAAVSGAVVAFARAFATRGAAKWMGSGDTPELEKD